jgi:hypothetical protein
MLEQSSAPRLERRVGGENLVGGERAKIPQIYPETAKKVEIVSSCTTNCEDPTTSYLR